jgi:hypothetical protein
LWLDRLPSDQVNDFFLNAEGTDEIDVMVPQRLDNSTNVFEAPREGKDHRRYFGFR